MRRVLYAAAAVFAAFSLFTACDKTDPDVTDNDNVENTGDGGETGGDITGGDETGSIETDVIGQYSGKLTVTTDEPAEEPTEQDQSINITMTDNSEDAIDLSVTDFSLGGSINIGTITLKDLKVTESDRTYTFTTEEAQTITLEGSVAALIQSCAVTAEGSVTDGKLTLSLDIAATTISLIPGSDPSVINVKVNFTGTKTVSE